MSDLCFYIQIIIYNGQSFRQDWKIGLVVNLVGQCAGDGSEVFLHIQLSF